jgi:hypothetical protein
MQVDVLVPGVPAAVRGVQGHLSRTDAHCVGSMSL